VIKVGDQILQIETEGAKDGALVERILWNGEVIQGLRIHADQLLQGGTLRFEFKG
jgi:putative alpha-1,2-mannosidase